VEEAHLRAAVHAFELSLLSLAGYQPELRHCLGCREPIQPEVNFFSVEAGGVFCPSCAADPERSPRNREPIGVDALKVLRNLQSRPEAVVGKLTLPAAVLEEVEEVLNSYIHRLLERQPKAAGFIDTLSRSAAFG
jgi:DNA repair protein RecO (recombination protein O)